jgi:hypothetical protein
VSVTGTAAGTQNNTTGAVTSAEGGTGGTASASVVVVAPPSISKVFGAANVAVNGTTSLTLTITNPNAGTALSGVAVTDNLPTGLVVATPSGLSDTCGGVATAVAGSTSVSLSGGSIAASSSCAVGVNVTPTTSGPELNTTGNVTSTNGGTGNVASASLQAGDFKILVFPPSETIPAGHMAVYALTLSSASGFTGHINLTCSGGPPKSKCTIIPPSVTLSSGSKLAAAIIDLSVPKGASLGTFTITFTGTSGSLSHSATASLTVK